MQVGPNRIIFVSVKVIDVSKERDFSPEKMKKVSLFDTERLFCDIYCLEPGQEQKPHRHEDSDKVYLVLEGKGRFRIGSDEEELSQNMAVLAPAGVEHGVVNNSKERLAVLVFVAPKPKGG